MDENRDFGQVVVDGLNMFDVITFLDKKKRRYIKVALDSLEEVMPADSKQFIATRKIFLDKFNDYHRSILITLFGDIEGLS